MFLTATGPISLILPKILADLSGMSLALTRGGHGNVTKTELTLGGSRPMKWRFEAMTTDERDILELLKDELDFIEKGGYGRSVRTPWQSKSTFQDSLSCINYGYPYRAHPCSECHLLDFVSPEHRTEEIPCHHIPLNTNGDTIEELESEENQAKLEREVSEWLRAKIKQIEEERAAPLTV